MGVGKLKMWNADRFGFIADDAGGPDTFLHINDLRSAGIDPDTIKIGERLTFEITSTRDGKTKAGNIRRGLTSASVELGRTGNLLKNWTWPISSRSKSMSNRFKPIATIAGLAFH